MTGIHVIEKVSAEEDLQAVRLAFAQFFDALGAMLAGNPEPLQDVWSHADDVTYMGADGRFALGWDAVFADWKAQTAVIAGGAARSENLQITLCGDMAVCVNRTEGQTRYADGTIDEVCIRETSVFRKEDDAWKMISHHADPLVGLARQRCGDESD